MQKTIAELPKECPWSNGMLANTINSLRETLLAKRRRPCDRKLTRRQWERDKAQMRFQLGVYTELLTMRTRIEKAKSVKKVKPLAEPVSGFDSDLLTPAEIDVVRESALVTANLLGEFRVAGTFAVLPLLTTICEERRAK